jgi:hypothetical protein
MINAVKQITVDYKNIVMVEAAQVSNTVNGNVIGKKLNNYNSSATAKTVITLLLLLMMAYIQYGCNSKNNSLRTWTHYPKIRKFQVYKWT